MLDEKLTMCQMKVRGTYPSAQYIHCTYCRMGWSITEDPLCPFTVSIPTPEPSAPGVAIVISFSLILLALIGGLILKSLMGF